MSGFAAFSYSVLKERGFGRFACRGVLRFGQVAAFGSAEAGRGTGGGFGGPGLHSKYTEGARFLPLAKRALGVWIALLGA